MMVSRVAGSYGDDDDCELSTLITVNISIFDQEDESTVNKTESRQICEMKIQDNDKMISSSTIMHSINVTFGFNILGPVQFTVILSLINCTKNLQEKLIIKQIIIR